VSYLLHRTKLSPDLFPKHFGWAIFAMTDTLDGDWEKRFMVAIGEPGYRVERRYHAEANSPWEVVFETLNRDEAMASYNGLG